jgi:hypothetical protein
MSDAAARRGYRRPSSLGWVSGRGWALGKKQSVRRYGVVVILIAATIASSGGPSAGGEGRATGQNSAQRRLAVGGGRTTTIGDPQDVEEPCTTGTDCPVDIRAVSKRRFTTATGRKMLAFSVLAYELYGGLNFVMNIKLRLDTKAGPHSDAHIFMAVDELWANIGWACGRHYRAGGQIRHKYPIKERGERLTCFVPRRELHPDKPIRFAAFSRSWGGFVVDRAPDNGWGGA